MEYECTCGQKLIKRKNRYTKDSFYGCEGFPKCRVSIAVEDVHHFRKRTTKVNHRTIDQSVMRQIREKLNFHKNIG